MSQRFGTLIEALKLAKYERIAVQVDDSKLINAPDIIDALQKELPDSRVSLLGDSVTQCCLDEVAAEHYGSECIVKLGHTCWFHSQRIVSYFISDSVINPEILLKSFLDVKNENPKSTIVLFVNDWEETVLVREHMEISGSSDSQVLICLSPCMSYPEIGEYPSALTRLRQLGNPFARRASAVAPRIPPRIAGRLVFTITGEQLSNPELVCADPNTRFIVATADSLYPRLINRFGTSRDRVVLATTPNESLLNTNNNYKELLRRYRGVESVKFACTIGIVVTHCAASKELFMVRDVLASFLRAAGKEIHMFSMSNPDGVKLGNFPEIDCFVIMSCPETEYFESQDLMADCVGPFEALVAMDAMDWSDHIVTDYDEMLSKMVMDLPPRTPRTPRQRRKPAIEFVDPNTVKIAPAKIEMGLRGIPSRYVSEPPR